MTVLADDLRVIDADQHYTEPHDLWTRQAPSAYKDRVPHVEIIDDRPMWIVDGASLGFARGGGVIDRAGVRYPGIAPMQEKGQDWVHPGAYDPQARLQVMDECGIYAAVLFPNILGFGGQYVNNIVPDPDLRLVCIQLYNDTLAQMSADSDDRLLGMAVMPAWDLEASVREAERMAALGLRGITITADPQDMGAPDLADHAWDALWEVCSDKQLPVHFHIGSSNTTVAFCGTGHWPSQHELVKPAIGATIGFLHSSRVMINAIFAGIFDRFPSLQMVLVESGIGYVPFFLEAMDWELRENAPEQFAQLSKKPSEYFESNWYATYWFEENRGNLQNLVDTIGDERILFETDYPHPTCLYPQPLESSADRLSALRPESRRRILGENASRLYRL